MRAQALAPGIHPYLYDMNAAQSYANKLKGSKSIIVESFDKITTQESRIVYVTDDGVRHTVELDNDNAEILSHETEHSFQEITRIFTSTK